MPDAKHFSMLRDAYLKREFPQQRQAMLARGTLEAHLLTVGEDCAEMFEDMMAQMMARPDLPVVHHERVKALEAMPEMVRDVINHEFIWVRPPI